MNININYGTNGISKTIEAGASIESIVSNSSIRAVLGYGDSVRVLIDGVEQSLSAIINDDCDLDIETRANSKASDVRVRISYGANGIDKVVPYGTTIANITSNSSVKAVLGFGDSVRCLIDGVEQGTSAIVYDNCNVVIETKANSKAQA